MPTTTPTHRTNGSRVPSAAGLILLDRSGKPVYYNPEAIAVLSYLKPPQDLNNITNVLLQEIPQWIHAMGLSDSSSSAKFISGRRHYICRRFTLIHYQRPLPCLTAFLLERLAARSLDVSAVARQFHLSQREQETVDLLTLGLTSKEIASRMNISPNTVKSFFRLVMTKMAVSTRSGIVGKIARM